MLTRGFGIELECFLPEGHSMQDAAAAVAARGIPCHVETYNHSLRPTWKAVTDGSLGNMIRGAEFVSPILRGEEGLNELVKVCEALTDFGCTVNRSCGLHVHVGVGDAPLSFFKTLTKLYGAYEPTVLDKMMPPSRRASTNHYCRTMATVSATAIDRAASLDALISTISAGEPQHERRYRKLNLVAYARHRTVEFRQHSGTLDARKVRTWTMLCLRMVDAAMRGVELVSQERPRNKARPGSKAHAIGEMLLRPEGVTHREVLAATGWPSVSIPQKAKDCGIEFTTHRTGREVRYYARMQAGASFDVSIAGFCTKIGATEDERLYIETRTRNLSGSVQWAA